MRPVRTALVFAAAVVVLAALWLRLLVDLVDLGRTR